MPSNHHSQSVQHTHSNHHSHSVIRTAAPDLMIQGLLALPVAQLLPLDEGGTHRAPLGKGAYEIIAAVRGEPMLSYNDRAETPIHAGASAVLCAAGSYTVRAEKNCLCMTVRLSGELADRLLAPEEDCIWLPQSAAAVRETVMALSVLDREGGAVDGVTASSYAYSLLMKLHNAALAGVSDGYSMLVEAAVGIIKEEFAFLEGLDELAERLEVSKAHLIRCFTREVGVSPGKYITRTRIEYAKLLLCEEGSSVTFAAEASGFANANYFTKVFRRETGMSPSEYLQSAPRTPPKPRASRRLDTLYML